MKRLLGEERGSAKAILDGDSDYYKTRNPDNPDRGFLEATERPVVAAGTAPGSASSPPLAGALILASVRGRSAALG